MGLTDGILLGATVGKNVDAIDGHNDGTNDGNLVVALDGSRDGRIVGTFEGTFGTAGLFEIGLAKG